MDSPMAEVNQVSQAALYSNHLPLYFRTLSSLLLPTSVTILPSSLLTLTISIPRMIFSYFPFPPAIYDFSLTLTYRLILNTKNNYDPIPNCRSLYTKSYQIAPDKEKKMDNNKYTHSKDRKV